MEMQCLLVILGGLRLVMFPIYGGEVTFCNFYIPKCNKSKAIIYSKKSTKYSKFRQTSENQGVMRNSLIIKGLEGSKWPFSPFCICFQGFAEYAINST